LPRLANTGPIDHNNGGDEDDQDDGTDDQGRRQGARTADRLSRVK
jgi:hypothetical protein